MASSDFRTDWGVRSLATSDPRHSPDAYQTGSVWPVWNAGVIIGDYQVGRQQDAFRNWRSMIDLRQLGGLGPMPEVLHGRYCQRTGESVPHQMFSELAVQNGFYDGLLGLQVDVPGQALTLSPQLPAAWPELQVDRIPFGDECFNLQLASGKGRFRCRLDLTMKHPPRLHLSPHLPAGSQVISVHWNGKPCRHEISDLPASVRLTVVQPLQRGVNELSIAYQSGVDFGLPRHPLYAGQMSQEVRLLAAEFADRTWRLQLEGHADARYPVDFYSASPPTQISHGRLVRQRGPTCRVELIPPANASTDESHPVRWETHVHFPLDSERESGTPAN
jgi:hypothetical protein